ncbi:MAG: porin family protein [Bacteroidota bacterium]|nr:porin family protein [Bacteroidota bacterium]MDX5505260.1 porin family protein [Bacteroidota bacterium]
MKKKIFLMALGLMSYGAFAQFESGTIQATGGINFNSGSTETDGVDQFKNSGFGIQLGGGYFIMDRVSVGLGIAFNSAKNTNVGAGQNQGDIVNKSTQFLIAPYARYYFPYTDRFSAFGQFHFAYGSGSSETENGGTTVDGPSQSLINVGVAPGFNYFLTETFALEMRYGFLGYQSVKTEQDNGNGGTTETNSGNFGLNLDLNTINFGFALFF